MDCSTKADDSEPEDEQVLSDSEPELENLSTVEAIENGEMKTDFSDSESMVNGKVDVAVEQDEHTVKDDSVAALHVEGILLFYDRTIVANLDSFIKVY